MKDAGLSQRVEIGLVVILLLAAAVLRMGRPGLTEFKADEARLLALALDMAQGQGIALRGISSSVGFPNFPMSVWLYALPVWVWPHPYAATLFTGLLNVLAAVVGYWFVRRYWGTKAALAATLMLAVNPWAVIFSRKIWAQNLLPLFVMGWGVSAALAFAERRDRFILLHFLCLATAVQIHLAAVALIPMTAVLLLVFRRRVNWKLALVGGLLAALTAAPFAYYLWQNRGQAALPAAAGSAGVINLDSFRFTAMLSLGYDIHSLAGATAFEDYLALAPDMTAVYWLWGALIFGGLLVMIRDWRLKANGQPPAPSNPHRRDVALIVLLWLAGPPLFFLWHNTPVFLHYFIATLPAPYIAAGVLFTRLLDDWLGRGRRWVSAAGWGALAGTAVMQTWALVALLSFLGRTATPGGFGAPLAMKLQAVTQARAMMAATGAAEILLVGPGESPRVDAFPAVYDALLRDSPRRFVNISRSALFPAHPVVALLEGESGMADLYLETAVRRQEIPLRSGEGSLHVVALPDSAAPAADVSFETPYLLTNWVHVIGYDKPAVMADETAVWQIHWRTGDNPDPTDYQFFSHLIDGGGQRVSQVDAPAFSPRQWQAGDVVVSRFQLTWPEEGERPYTLRAGMYRYPSLEPALLLDAAGNPYADAIEIDVIESK